MVAVLLNIWPRYQLLSMSDLQAYNFFAFNSDNGVEDSMVMKKKTN
jgi:hypothetical protein